MSIRWYRYTPADRQRRHREPGADPASRPGSPFAVDHARVVHSVALRALAGKPQALDVEEGRSARTRLAHSLEVARIARAIGTPLGADPWLLETAGLAHDLGHPPFGHNGETALDEIARPAGGYNANAQTLRILTRLEPGTPTAPAGLNLTRAALDATCKYPWPRRPGDRRFGVYDDDQPTFAWLRHGHTEPTPSFEAQIVDWADDIANAVADLDDGIRARLLRPNLLADRGERAAIALLAADRITTLPAADIETAAAELARRPAVTAFVRDDYDGSPHTEAALHHLTRSLTEHYIAETVAQARPEHGPHSRQRQRLGVPVESLAEIAWLRAFTLHHILRAPARRDRRHRQRQTLVELADALLADAPHTLDPPSAHAWATADDDPARLRIVVDHIAGLTDAGARARHRALLACPPGRGR
ncbi:deoxyguanosinetriphosphate triphosphohydrolase [Frankia sp. Cas4]|uniref:deoxyguanosinetriphosphate triphosphohydrolase n=1 Tax=Frankia sp. Cas4 TaxID=3073927 RepID=UPI002AD31FBB|nr:deoxyguanosinetriphosphate triphosphohydrolase [Frankia sp. Cas4]